MKWLKSIYQSRFVLIFMFVMVADAKAFDLSAAINLIERKDYQRAEPILRQYLAVKEDAETLYLLGFLLIETYRFNEAEQYLRRAVAARPQQAHWLMALAKSLLEQGKNIAAGEILEQAIALEPMSTYYHAHAMTALNSGNLATAEASLRACLAIDAVHSEALNALGGLLIDQGQNEEGIVFLERARTVNPQNLDTLYRLGMAYRQVGKLPEAEELLLIVVKRVPGHVGALYNLSRVLIQSGNNEAASKVMEQFIAMSELRDEIDFNTQGVRKNPGNVEGRIYLASLYLRAGRTREALNQLHAARVLAPGDVRIYRSLATAYQRLGDQRNAAQANGYADMLEAKNRE